MWHDSYVPWPIYSICAVSHDMCCDLFLYGAWRGRTALAGDHVTWSLHMSCDSFVCVVTQSYVPWCMHVCRDLFIRDMTHSYVTWRMYMWQYAFICDMTDNVYWRVFTSLYMWRASFICAVTHPCVTWHICSVTRWRLTWRICDMTDKDCWWVIRSRTGWRLVKCSWAHVRRGSSSRPNTVVAKKCQATRLRRSRDDVPWLIRMWDMIWNDSFVVDLTRNVRRCDNAGRGMMCHDSSVRKVTQDDSFMWVWGGGGVQTAGEGWDKKDSLGGRRGRTAGEEGVIAMGVYIYIHIHTCTCTFVHTYVYKTRRLGRCARPRSRFWNTFECK